MPSTAEIDAEEREMRVADKMGGIGLKGHPRGAMAAASSAIEAKRFPKLEIDTRRTNRPAVGVNGIACTAADVTDKLPVATGARSTRNARSKKKNEKEEN